MYQNAVSQLAAYSRYAANLSPFLQVENAESVEQPLVRKFESMSWRRLKASPLRVLLCEDCRPLLKLRS